MDEFELQSWERELAAWRRRLPPGEAPPALLEELEAAAAEIAVVRRRLRDRVRISGERVVRHFTRLRAAWEYYCDGESRTTPA